MPIIAPSFRTERRQIQKTLHKKKDKSHARRLTAMLMLHRGDAVSHVARTLCCARSPVGRWINWFTLYGVEGLKSLPAWRGRRWPFEHICALLRDFVKYSLGDSGWQRSRWSTGLLAIKIHEITGCPLLRQPYGGGYLLPDWDWHDADNKSALSRRVRMKSIIMADALHSSTGKMSYVGENSKSLSLFISLLKHLKAM